MTVARAFAGSLLAGAIALVAPTARAELPPRTFRLDVLRTAGADQCPDVHGVRDAIAVAAHVDPVDPAAPARLVVSLAQAGAIARGRWELFDASGTKLRDRAITITGSCRQLVAELAMTFVVFYETPPAEPPKCPPATCDEACRARVREELRDEVRRELLAAGYRPRMDVGVAIMAGGLLSLNYTADPGGGLWLAGELHGEILSGALEARVLFPSRVVAEPTKFEFEVTSVSAAFVPCARWSVLLGCAVIDFGMLIAGVTTAQFAGPPVVATFGLGPRAAVHVPFADRFAFRAFADLRFAPVESSYTALDTGSRWRSNVVSGLFGIGLAFE